MPIYEYVCEGCQEIFEVIQKISDPAPHQHHCGSQKITRKLSKTSFVLKGGGWADTGYAETSRTQKSTNNVSSSKSETSASSDTSSKKDTTTPVKASTGS